MQLFKPSTLAALLAAVAAVAFAMPSPQPGDTGYSPDDSADGGDKGLEQRLAEIRDAALYGNNTNVAKRDDGPVFGVYECSLRNFKGKCVWQQLFKGEDKCYNRISPSSGSIGPDKFVSCTMYEAKDCVPWQGDAVQKDFKFPGVADCANQQWLWDSPSGMVVCPRSWRCEVTL